MSNLPLGAEFDARSSWDGGRPIKYHADLDITINIDAEMFTDEHDNGKPHHLLDDFKNQHYTPVQLMEKCLCIISLLRSENAEEARRCRKAGMDDDAKTIEKNVFDLRMIEDDLKMYTSNSIEDINNNTIWDV